MLKLLFLSVLLSFSFMLTSFSPKHPVSRPEEPVPLPGLKAWEENMIKYGLKHSMAEEIDILTSGVGEAHVWYYDGQRVFYQIADYTGDTRWHAVAAEKMNSYRNYVFNIGKSVPGWRVFPHGLYMDYLRTGDEKSKEAALLLADKSAYAPAGGGPGEALSRETAYCINTYLVAEALGEPRHPKLATAVEYALNHIDQWFVQNSSKNWAPFMFGITCEALISYYEQVEKDPRIPRAIQTGLDACWKRAWIEEKQAFFYRADNPAGAAATLNLLVAPAFAWVYLQTGDTTWRDRGDKVFAGGVRDSYLEGGKQFSQNYRWSFDYVKWRNQAEHIRIRKVSAK